MQHYTFAVQAFIETIKQYGMNDYEFEIYEETTYTVIAPLFPRQRLRLTGWAVKYTAFLLRH